MAAVKQARPIPVPKLVLAYLEREAMFDSPEDFLQYLEWKIEQVGSSPSAIRYMTGSTYAEAVSFVRWYERHQKKAEA